MSLSSCGSFFIFFLMDFEDFFFFFSVLAFPLRPAATIAAIADGIKECSLERDDDLGCCSYSRHGWGDNNR